MRRLVCLAFALVALAPSIAAAKPRMFSYDPVSADAKRLTGKGLTFVFDQGLVRTRPLRVLATAVSARADFKPIGDGVLGAGGRGALAGDAPIDGELYEVDITKSQGRVYVRAWCPGSTKLWVAVPRIERSRELTITAIGDDPTKAGAARVCARMIFSWRGEWKLPGNGAPDPMEEVLDSAGLQNAN